MDDSDTTPEQEAARINVFAHMALGIGVMLPLVAALNRIGDIHLAGRFLGASALGVLILLGLLKLILKDHAPVGVAWAKLGIGIVLVVLGIRQINSAERDLHAIKQAARQVVATMNEKEDPGPAAAPATSEEARQIVAVVNGVNALLKRQMAQTDLLNKEFEKVDMGDTLTPSSLTTRTGIDGSRRKLVRFGELVGQRDRLLADSAAEGRQFLLTAKVPEHYRAPALANATKVAKQTLGLSAELSAVQKEFIKQMSTMLDFSQAQLGRTVMQKGDLMFAGERELATYRRLAVAIDKTGAREEAIVARFNAHVQQLKDNANNKFKTL
ncbi:hypothetical protein [Massilia sp. CCM 8734]|uniref:hypothetical protein n=1 Tax=Massilia sp. CCM 8734 TaxID=2609283 RepID=UPI001423CFD0|nr:hypothetical protein [Massilia sp. CCM 8734]NHZ99220.1 hypothetical protein [Massilia sp. CCM 8734]